MKALQAALWVEILKVRKSIIFRVSIYFFIFIGIMMGLLMYLSMHPDIASRSSTLSMKTSFLGGSDWNAFFNLMMQIILTVGVIGSGFVTAWIFGREFADRVIKDLLALPVSRASIVISKFIVLLIWSLILSATVLAAAVLTALIIDLPGAAEANFPMFLETYLICSLLNSLLITPVAFVASTGRGYMLPISFVILIIIITQILFVGMPQLCIWFPWALPAMYSGVAGAVVPSVEFISYLLYIIVILAGILATVWWWRYADHK